MEGEKKMEMTYIKVFLSYLDAVEGLEDDERGRLFTAMIEYARSGRVIELPGNERFVFPFIKGQLDRDRESYEKTVEARRRAGKASGEARRLNAERTYVNKDKGKGKGEDKDEEKGEEKGEEDLYITTTTTSRARTHSARECAGKGDGGVCGYAADVSGAVEADDDVEEMEEMEDVDEDAGYVVDSDGERGDDGGYVGGADGERDDDGGYVGDGGASEPAHVPPGISEVADYFRREHALDFPLGEAEKFIAYNAYRGWKCLPRWRPAADLWVVRMGTEGYGAIERDIARYQRERERAEADASDVFYF